MNINRDKLLWRWTVGMVIIGCNIFGLMFDWEALTDALSHHPYHYGLLTAAETTGLLVGGFVLPAAVTLLAPRKPFLWGAAALGVGLFWSLLDRVVALYGPGFLNDLETNGADSIVILLILCGPISFVRLLLRRRHDGKNQHIAQQQAWMQQTTEAQAGVWPPPPVKPTD